MTIESEQTLHDDGSQLSYFAHLSRTGRMPRAVQALIERYHITMYFDACDVGESKSVRPDVCDTETSSSTTSQHVNFNANNNEDDVEPDESPMSPAGTQTSSSPTEVLNLRGPSPTRRLSRSGRRSSRTSRGTKTSSSPTSVLKVKVLSLTWRLSNFGRRFTDKIKQKTGTKASWPSDSQLADSDTPSTSMTTVYDHQLTDSSSTSMVTVYEDCQLTDSSSTSMVAVCEVQEGNYFGRNKNRNLAIAN